MKKTTVVTTSLSAVLFLLLGITPALASYPGRNGLLVLSKRSPSQIATVRKDGTGTKILTDTGMNEAPEFSPDGKWIVFDEYLGNRLYVMHTDGSRFREVPTPNDGGSYPWSPSWSPNGSRIIYAASGGNSEIWVVRPDGSRNKQVGTLTGEWPRYSPNGEYITFDSGGQIWRMDADGSNAIALGGGGASNEYSDWSPNGKMLTYLRDGEIWRMAPDGSNQVQVTTTGATWGAVWSPSGTRLAFPESGGAVGFINPDGTGHKSVDMGLTECCVAWQPTP